MNTTIVAVTPGLRVHRMRMVDPTTSVRGVAIKSDVITATANDQPNDPRGRFIGVGVIACAQILLLPPRPYLYEIYVSDDCRRQGIGLELLGSIVKLYGEFRCAWVSAEGIALADSYERRFGKQQYWMRAAAENPAVLAMVEQCGITTLAGRPLDGQRVQECAT